MVGLGCDDDEVLLLKFMMAKLERLLLVGACVCSPSVLLWLTQTTPGGEGLVLAFE